MLLTLINLPFKDPVLIFAVILFIILLAPILLHRLRIPDLIGLIIAGAVIGPNGFGIIERDSSIELFSKVGLLYIMFVAGLEIDMADLKKNLKKSTYFGLLTFIIPMGLGIAAGIYLLDFSLMTSVLLASMFASHTLITYPIVSRYGVTKNRAVNISVGATVITCLLSLLVLAVVIGMATGEMGNYFWIRLTISTIVFVAIVTEFFPILGRWFFKRYEDRVGQYIFVLALVFSASFLAKLAGLEDIIGAFLAGLALNKLIPNTSALMNRIEFVGNALFIPFFLIGVGMLVDYRVFTSDWDALWVAFVMCTVAVTAKALSAWITEKTYRFSRDEGRLLFGLTNSQAAATLAAVLVGYQVIIGIAPDGEPIRLLNENVLNGTIIMILVTCTISSFSTQRGARNLALAEMSEDDMEDKEGVSDRILIPLGNAENVEELINLGVTIKSSKYKTSMVALSIIKSDVNDASAEKKSQMLLEKAAKTAAATDNLIQPLMRYDVDIVNGIKNVVKESKISDIVLGLNKRADISHTFLGDLAEGVLSRCPTTTFVYRSVQPLSTIKRYIMVTPPHAEQEVGFGYWLIRVWNLVRNSGSKIVFYTTPVIISLIKEIKTKHNIDADFKEFSDWNDFLILARDVNDDDALMVVMSRKNCPSYSRQMVMVPSYMNKYFQSNSCILIYPIQLGVGEEESFNSLSMLGYFEGGDLATTLRHLFKKNK
ncbi:MAG: cation:proton antiporter [Odoribacter sp.]|nr:cation:proton antiporter [Odoribacter sp.]